MFIEFNNQLINTQVISTIKLKDNCITLQFSKLHHSLNENDEIYEMSEVYEIEQAAKDRYKQISLELSHSGLLYPKSW